MAKCVIILRKYLPISIRSCAPINTGTWPIFRHSGHELNYRSAVSYCTAKIILEDDTTPKKKVSKAMRAYLERAKAHDEFMKEQLIQYNIGKRHLANMMGEDPETFTQDDVDKAIEYLFPSGLFEPRARPLMKPPDEVFPARKAAEFDESGRPHHFLFYTGRSHLFQLYYDIADHFSSLNDFEDKMIRKHLKPDTTQKIITSGSMWITKQELEKILVETVSDREYSRFVTIMDRLIEHPYSYRLKEFVEKFRKPMLSGTSALEIPKPQYDADGRAYVTTKECPRKSARADVTVRSPGTGKITINGQPLEYFENIQDREQR